MKLSRKLTMLSHRDSRPVSASPQRFRADFAVLEDLGRGAYGRVCETKCHAVYLLSNHSGHQGATQIGQKPLRR